MDDHYDFSRGRRGAVLPPSPQKSRITIRLDTDTVEWFKAKVHEAGGGNYQTLINEALRRHIQLGETAFEDLLRRVIREELQAERSMDTEPERKVS